MSLSSQDDPIKPELWHNIPKCVVDAFKFVLQKQKFDSGKLSQQGQQLNMVRDTMVKKDSKNKKAAEEMMKVLNTQIENRTRKLDMDITSIKNEHAADNSMSKTEMNQLSDLVKFNVSVTSLFL